MFTSRYLNNALNNVHERTLRLIFNDHEKSFNSILTENNLKTIHQKNWHVLKPGTERWNMERRNTECRNNKSATVKPGTLNSEHQIQNNKNPEH